MGMVRVILFLLMVTSAQAENLIWEQPDIGQTGVERWDIYYTDDPSSSANYVKIGALLFTEADEDMKASKRFVWPIPAEYCPPGKYVLYSVKAIKGENESPFCLSVGRRYDAPGEPALLEVE